MSLLQGKSRAKTGRRVVIDLQKAERALKEGHDKEVARLCAEVLEERPDSAQACQLMAAMLIRQERLDEAMDWITRARQAEPDNPRSLNLMGIVLERRGDLAGAEAAFREAVGGDPDYPDALANLGHVLLAKGDAAEAEQYFRHAIRHHREHGLANLSLGGLLHAQGKPAAAVPLLQAGIQSELSNRPGQYTLAVALQELGRLDEAITAYRRLVAAGDKDPEVFVGLADALVATGEPEVAMAGYETALELQPEHARAAAALAGLLADAGRTREALALTAPRVERGDAPVCLHLAHSRSLRSCERADEALLHLAELVKRPLEMSELSATHCLLGQLLHARGETDRAFAQHRRANRLRGDRYDAAAQEARMDGLAGTFSRDALDALPRGSDSDVPVFVIGLPRSGAAALERLIAGHARAAGAGSLPHIELCAGRLGRYNNAALPYPECVTSLRERDLRELSASYLARLFAAGGERARRIVDSTWSNFLHVGLIELMFPRARLIHCRRSPADTGLGSYFCCRDELPEAFGADFDDFTHYYGQHLRLMDHWRETTALPMLEVDFEVLARDREAEGRRVIDFLGLPWDPACLAGMSEALDGQPALDEAGWSARYGRHLQPLREALAAAGH